MSDPWTAIATLEFDSSAAWWRSSMLVSHALDPVFERARETTVPDRCHQWLFVGGPYPIFPSPGYKTRWEFSQLQPCLLRHVLPEGFVHERMVATHVRDCPHCTTLLILTKLPFAYALFQCLGIDSIRLDVSRKGHKTQDMFARILEENSQDHAGNHFEDVLRLAARCSWVVVARSQSHHCSFYSRYLGMIPKAGRWWGLHMYIVGAFHLYFNHCWFNSEFQDTIRNKHLSIFARKIRTLVTLIYSR